MSEFKQISVDLDEAARLTSLSPWTLRGYVKAGKLKATRCGRRIIIPIKNLEQLVEKGTTSRGKP